MFAGARKMPETAKFRAGNPGTKRLIPHSASPRLPSSGQSKILRLGYKTNISNNSNSDG